jgi:hypothetical protein
LLQLEAASAGLSNIYLLPQNLEAPDLLLPFKFSGMLASGIHLIATCRKDIYVARECIQCGLIVVPDDSAYLCRSIVQPVDDNEARKTLGFRHCIPPMSILKTW